MTRASASPSVAWVRKRALFAFLSLWAGQAEAAPEELVLALEPELGLLVATEESGRWGGGGGISAWLGLTDALWLAANVAVARHSGGEESTPVLLGEGYLGLVAALDVFRAIPFVELGLGAVVGPQVAPTARLGAGLDYLFTPELGVGGVLRYRPLTDDLAADARWNLALRFFWRWEL